MAVLPIKMVIFQSYVCLLEVYYLNKPHWSDLGVHKIITFCVCILCVYRYACIFL